MLHTDVGKQGSDVRGMVTSLTWGANPRKKIQPAHIYATRGREIGGSEKFQGGF
jgi:hypothetical protein